MTGPYDATKPASVTAPPPWTLLGRAIVCLARTVDGRAGFLAFARWFESPVGPYDEVLWVPRIAPPHRVTAIRVSSLASVEAGRKNWGIPKALAGFEWEESGRKWTVHARDPSSGDVFALLEAETHGLRVPLASGFVPAALRRFEQPWEGKRYRFAPAARGRVRPARVTAAHLEGYGFPDLAGVVAGFTIEDLRLTLPAPEIVAGG